MTASPKCEVNNNAFQNENKLGDVPAKNVILCKKYYYTPVQKIKWTKLALMVISNSICLYSYYLILSYNLLYTVLFAIYYGVGCGLGVTAGAHRLWAHKSYKAKLPLRIFLMIAQTATEQQSIYKWARDHRVHHKYSDTDADPHNVRRGFFFAHMGWLFREKHPEMLIKGKKLDTSDLLDDLVVAFQYKYYNILFMMFSVIIPLFVPIVFWNETLFNSACVNMMRWTILLHSTWFVNSAAHMFGDRPYDGVIKPAENIFVSFGALGEGYHNYHHTFPFDYATGELGGKFNLTKKFIDAMAYLGLAYDLKRASDSSIESRREKTKLYKGGHE